MFQLFCYRIPFSIFSFAETWILMSAESRCYRFHVEAITWRFSGWGRLQENFFQQPLPENKKKDANVNLILPLTFDESKGIEDISAELKYFTRNWIANSMKLSRFLLWPFYDKCYPINSSIKFFKKKFLWLFFWHPITHSFFFRVRIQVMLLCNSRIDAF